MKTLNCLVLSIALTVSSAFTAEVLSVAIFNFESPDESMRDLGQKVSAMINAQLSADPRIITVERAELEKALGEQEMGLSGTISPDSAAKIGNLTGAKVLVTGKVFKIDRELALTTKIIGTETSRVYGEMVKGPSDGSVSSMASQLARSIGDTIVQRADTLQATPADTESAIQRLKSALGSVTLPVVTISLPERHVSARTIDPAAETEVSMVLKECGFTVVEPKGTPSPEVELVGEAFSELGMRKGNLISCKARVELKAIQKSTGKILAIDRQTSVAVDLSEQIAAKSALQKAAQVLAPRFIEKMVQNL
jgi:hypothetical protein